MEENASYDTREEASHSLFLLNTLRGVDVDEGAANGRYTISLNDIIPNSSKDISAVLLCNFMYDIEWLFSTCTTLYHTDVTIVHGHQSIPNQSKDPFVESIKEVKKRATGNFDVISPKLPFPFGTFHGKLILVKFKSHIRVAVLSANFIESDWYRKNQAVWMQDFPEKNVNKHTDKFLDKSVTSSSEQIEKMARENFLEPLKSYLSACNVKNWVDIVSRYDYSTTTACLVVSIPGIYKTADTMKKQGLGALKYYNHVANSYPPSDCYRGVICQFSSLGSISLDWLNCFYNVLCMNENTTPETMAKKSGTKKKVSLPPCLKEIGNELGKIPLSIVFPTVEDVRNSLDGWESGNSLPVTRKNIKPFLLPYFCRLFYESFGSERAKSRKRKLATFEEINSSESGLSKEEESISYQRRRAMPHMKSYFSYRLDPKQKKKVMVDYIYVGSHNLSKAAWGEFQKENSQLFVRNYEIGVYISPQTLKWKKPWTSNIPKKNEDNKLSVLHSDKQTAFSENMLKMWHLDLHSNEDCTSPRIWGSNWYDSCSSVIVPSTGGNISRPSNNFFVYLPFQVPPMPYENDEPWNCTDPRNKPDAFGRIITL